MKPEMLVELSRLFWAEACRVGDPWPPRDLTAEEADESAYLESTSIAIADRAKGEEL